VKKRFSEEQIIGFLKEADLGMPVKELCRKRGFSEASFYLWEMKSHFSFAKTLMRNHVTAATTPGQKSN
jgi:putative transposase